MRDRRSRATAVVDYAVLGVASIVTLLPLWLSVSTAFKSPKDFVSSSPLAPPTAWTAENFSRLLDDRIRFLDSTATTVLIAVFLVATQVPLSILAAHAFANHRFAGRRVLFALYLATLLVPATVLAIPLYLMMSALGLGDTFWAFVVPFTLGSPFAIFLLHQHFAAIPREILDASRLDGASDLAVLFRVVVPLTKPAVATVVIITVVTQWNSFLWPRVIAGADWQTITVATAGLQGQYASNWTLVLAATTIAIVPMLALFLSFQNQLTKTLIPGGSW